MLINYTQYARDVPDIQLIRQLDISYPGESSDVTIR